MGGVQLAVTGKCGLDLLIPDTGSLRETLSKRGVIAMRFEKPKKNSGRPDFVAGRMAELERQLATETNETRKSELRNEINEWQRSRLQPKRDGGK